MDNQITIGHNGDWTVINNTNCCIRVDYNRSNKSVEYDRDGEWTATPYQTADIDHQPYEQCLAHIAEWLDWCAI